MATTRGSAVSREREDAPPVRLRESFDAFYLREYPKMVALAAAVSGSRLVAEDLAQEAMLRAHRRWDRVAGYEMPGAWMRRVTINLAVSATRRRRADLRRMLRLGPQPSIPPPEPVDERVWHAVAALPGKQRAAIALHYLEDLSIGEIAQVLEVAESTARVHLHRGREALASALRDQEPYR